MITINCITSCRSARIKKSYGERMRRTLIAILMCISIFGMGSFELLCNCNLNAQSGNVSADTGCHKQNDKDSCKGNECCHSCFFNQSFLPFALNFSKQSSKPIFLELPYRPHLVSEQLIFSHLISLEKNFFIPHHAIDIIKFTYSPQGPPITVMMI